LLERASVGHAYVVVVSGWQTGGKHVQGERTRLPGVLAQTKRHGAPRRLHR
jgi:hypothetical protein